MFAVRCDRRSWAAGATWTNCTLIYIWIYTHIHIYIHIHTYRYIDINLCNRAWTAGATWTNRTLAAPWVARYAHTSVVDATGAIYVLGGSGYSDGFTDFQDVWASTDGGARAGLRQRGYEGGYWVGTQGVLGDHGALTGTKW